MTNREWLNTLSDEEFAKWHTQIGCGACIYNNASATECAQWYVNDEHKCQTGTTKWLEAEHEEDEQ